MSACHDAIRKAITAHLAANGLRARSGDGAHRIINNYARHQLADVITTTDLDDADSIRRDRIVTAIAKTLAAQAKPTRNEING